MLSYIYGTCCVNSINIYCKKFKGSKHNREAISVRAVWLSGRTQVYQLGGENRPGFKTRNILIVFFVNCLHYASSYRGCIPKVIVSIENLIAHNENYRFSVLFSKFWNTARILQSSIGTHEKTHGSLQQDRSLLP